MNKSLNNKVLDISNTYYNYLMSLQNVIGIGLGHKRINNINIKEPCIHVLVRHKIENKYIATNNIIPKNYMGIKTDVIKSGNFNFCYKEAVPGKMRPLKGGYGISSGDFSGTIGCIVTKTLKAKKIHYILSNNHILAGINKIPIGSPIFQPSQIHGASPVFDKVAFLSDFVPLNFQNKFFKPTNIVDAAIAKIANYSLVSNEIGFLGAIKGIGKAKLDLYVRKVGMNTGLTHGTIKTIGSTLNIGTLDKPLLFKNQIVADLFSKKGDSGSVLVDEFNNIIGLLFATSTKEDDEDDDEDDESICNDISIVLKKLKVDLFIK